YFHDDELPPPDDRLVVFSTFSKAWGLAALRLGWLCTTPSTAAEIRKAKLPYSLNVVSEETAIVALENRAYRDANVATIVAERERLFEAMRAIDGIEPFPSRANFIAFRCRDARATFESLSACAPRATSTSTITTPSKTPPSCSAKRSRKRSVTKPAFVASATHTCRSMKRSRASSSISRDARSSSSTCRWIARCC